MKNVYVFMRGKNAVEVAAEDVVDNGAVHQVDFDDVKAAGVFSLGRSSETGSSSNLVSFSGAFRKCDVTSGSADVPGVDRLGHQSVFFFGASFTF